MLLRSTDQPEVSKYQSSPLLLIWEDVPWCPRFEESDRVPACKPFPLLSDLGLSLQGSEAASKGDFLFSSDHLIEMATKLYRTTLSQTNQKLNIEISDEYVHVLYSTLFTLCFSVGFGSPVSSLNPTALGPVFVANQTRLLT